MKKLLPFIVGAIVILGGLGFYISNKDDSSDKTNNDSSASQENSSSETAANKYTDACKVFEDSEIDSALGGTFGDGETDISVSSSDGLEGSACAYDQDNDGTTAGMTQALGLSVNVNNYNDEASAKDFMAQTNSSTEVEGETVFGFVNIDDAGDEAFFANSAAYGDKVEMMYVRVGNQIMVVSVTRLAGLDKEAVRAGMTTLAKSL